MPELLNDPFAETNDVLRETYRRCHEDAGVALSNLEFTTTEFGGPIKNALADLALTATVAGDYERVRRYSGSPGLRDSPPPVMAKASLAADIARVKHGSLRKILAHDYESSHCVTGMRPSRAISELAAAAAGHGFDPQRWIDRYNLPSSQIWDTQAEYWRQLAQNPDTYAVDKLTPYVFAEHLSRSSEATDAEVHEKTLGLLRIVSDTETNTQLTKRFIEAAAGTSYGIAETSSAESKISAQRTADRKLNELLTTSMATILDPVLATPENVEALGSRVETALDERYGSLAHPEPVRLWYQTWELLVSQSLGFTPETTLSIAEKQTKEQILRLEEAALKGQNIPAEDLLRYKEFYQEHRDENLAILALRYASTSEFSSALTCASAIDSPTLLEHAFCCCLDVAQTVEQLEELIPDNLIVQFNPTLGTYWQIARTRFIEDHEEAYDQIYELGANLATKAKAYGESPYQAEAKGLERLYRILQTHAESESAHTDFVTITLSTLREGYKLPYRSASMRTLSRIAMDLGHTSEAGKAYEYIGQRSREEPAERLADLAAFATVLSCQIQRRERYLFKDLP